MDTSKGQPYNGGYYDPKYGAPPPCDCHHSHNHSHSHHQDDAHYSASAGDGRERRTQGGGGGWLRRWLWADPVEQTPRNPQQQRRGGSSPAQPSTAVGYVEPVPSAVYDPYYDKTPYPRYVVMVDSVGYIPAGAYVRGFGSSSSHRGHYHATYYTTSRTHAHSTSCPSHQPSSESYDDYAREQWPPQPRTPSTSSTSSQQPSDNYSRPPGGITVEEVVEESQTTLKATGCTQIVVSNLDDSSVPPARPGVSVPTTSGNPKSSTSSLQPSSSPEETPGEAMRRSGSGGDLARRVKLEPPGLERKKQEEEKKKNREAERKKQRKAEKKQQRKQKAEAPNGKVEDCPKPPEEKPPTCTQETPAFDETLYNFGRSAPEEQPEEPRVSLRKLRQQMRAMKEQEKQKANENPPPQTELQSPTESKEQPKDGDKRAGNEINEVTVGSPAAAAPDNATTQPPSAREDVPSTISSVEKGTIETQQQPTPPEPQPGLHMTQAEELQQLELLMKDLPPDAKSSLRADLSQLLDKFLSKPPTNNES